jgi:single-strand DNA-binding protein
MAYSLNSCSFIGSVGKDPEIRFTQSGDVIASFSLACSESYKDKAGQKIEKTEWINVSVFGGLAKIVQSYVKKGSKLFLCGKFTTDKYTDKNGVEKYSTKIVVSGFGGQILMLDSPGQQQHSQNQHSQSQQPQGNQQQGQNQQGNQQAEPDFDDDIPF